MLESQSVVSRPALPTLRSLSEGAFLYSSGNLLNYGIGFLLLPVFTRYLLPEDYGVLSMLNMLVSFSVSIFSLGLGASIGLCYAEKNTPEHIGRTLGSALFVLALSGSLLGVCGFVFSKELSVQLLHSAEYATLVRYAVLTTCLLLFSIPLTLFLQLQHRATAFVRLTLCSAVITAGCRLFMVVGLHRGVGGAMEGWFVGQVLSFLLFFIYVWRSADFALDQDVIKRLIRWGIPLVPSFAILFLLQKGNQYILQRNWGLEDVGLYSVGYSAGILMSMLVGGFTTAWTPFFLSFMNRQEESRPVFGSVFSYYVITFGFITLLFYALARPFVLVMTKPNFYEAYKVIGLVATSEFFVGIFSLLLPALYFKQELKFVPVIQGAAAIVALGINLLLIPRLHYVGAALALVSGMFCMAFFQQLWNRVRGPYYLSVQYELRRVAVAGALYTVLAALSFIHPQGSLLHQGLQSGALIAAGACVLWGLLTGSERDRLKGYLGKLQWKLI